MTDQTKVGQYFRSEDIAAFVTDGVAQLENVDWSGCGVQDVSLAGANMQGANLSRAHLKNVSLERADLTQASLEKGIFEDVSFVNAIVDGADTQGARFIRCKFGKDFFDRVRGEPAVVRYRFGITKKWIEFALSEDGIGVGAFVVVAIVFIFFI